MKMLQVKFLIFVFSLNVFILIKCKVISTMHPKNKNKLGMLECIVNNIVISCAMIYIRCV